MVDDGRTTDGRRTDGRTTEHGYTISSPCEPDGSGELMIRNEQLPRVHDQYQYMHTITCPLQNSENTTEGSGVLLVGDFLLIHLVNAH